MASRLFRHNPQNACKRAVSEVTRRKHNTLSSTQPNLGVYVRTSHVHEERACQCADNDANAEPKEAVRCIAGTCGDSILHITHDNRLK